MPKQLLWREVGDLRNVRNVCGGLRLTLCLPELLQRIQSQFQHQTSLKLMLHAPKQLLLWEQTAVRRCSDHSRKRRHAFNTGMH